MDGQSADSRSMTVGSSVGRGRGGTSWADAGTQSRRRVRPSDRDARGRGRGVGGGVTLDGQSADSGEAGDATSWADAGTQESSRVRPHSTLLPPNRLIRVLGVGFVPTVRCFLQTVRCFLQTGCYQSFWRKQHSHSTTRAVLPLTPVGLSRRTGGVQTRDKKLVDHVSYQDTVQYIPYIGLGRKLPNDPYP